MMQYYYSFQSICKWLKHQYNRLGITEIQVSILMALTDAHAAEQNELVTDLGIEKGTASKAVKQLVADGYIRRETRRKDKRVHILRPTHKAFYVRQQIGALHHMIEKILLEDYLPGASELLEYYLKTMMENIPRLIETEFNPAPPYGVDVIPDDPRKITPEQWEAMRKVDIRAVDKSQLVDIRTIKIDEKLSPIDRWLSYLKQVKNPYCVRVGDMAMKISCPDESHSDKSTLC